MLSLKSMQNHDWIPVQVSRERTQGACGENAKEGLAHISSMMF